MKTDMFRRFFDYIDKVFDFNHRLGEITDTRVRPQIGTLQVVLSSFAMQATRLSSLNALDVELHVPKKIEGIMLVQCFYERNLKAPMRKVINSVIALANQLYAGLGIDGDKVVMRRSGCRPP
jgi:hypothetical protein